METNSTTATQFTNEVATNAVTTTRAIGAGQVVRALTTALCATAFVVMMAVGAPDEQASRWDDGVDAHSEIGYEAALDTTGVTGRGPNMTIVDQRTHRGHNHLVS